MKKKLLILFFTVGSFAQTQIGLDIDGESADDQSGWSTALSADGTILAIGAPFNDANGSNSGHVRVYKNLGGNWTQIGNDIDGEAIFNQSGYRVSLSADGTIVAIAAPMNNSSTGHVRIYKNISGIWTQLGSDIDGEVQGAGSGYSISISSDGFTVAISSTTIQLVKVFHYVGGTWTQVGTNINGIPNTNFGFSVSLSADGTVIAIGSNTSDLNATNSGNVSVYRK